MAIKIFFHICAITRVLDVVQNMLRSIIYSGMYDEVERIYCYISGEEDLIYKVIHLLHEYGSKFTVVKAIIGDTSYERLTLEDIHHHVTAMDKILYIHSKGVSVYHQLHPEYLPCIDDWTEVMMYFLIRHYKICVEKLETVDTVGVSYKNENHWCGNFWWVRGDYFLTLPTKIGPHYYDPEKNFLFVNKPRIYEIHNTGEINHYAERYPFQKYIDLNV
jgi:hypothetical protein